MLLMDYLYITGIVLPDYSQKATSNLLHAYIDANSQIVLDKYTGNGV